MANILCDKIGELTISDEQKKDKLHNLLPDASQYSDNDIQKTQPIQYKLCRIFILDWDDTLLPSSALTADNITLSSPTISDEIAKKLETNEKIVYQLLTNIINAQFNIYIVTNAEQGWVELSAKKFMPTIADLFKKYKNNITILSAQTIYSWIYPNNNAVWKYMAVNEILKHFDSDTIANIISFGDSENERTALINNSNKFKKNFCKSIKFVGLPSYEKLCRQLQYTIINLNNIISHRGPLDLMMKIQDNLVANPQK